MRRLVALVVAAALLALVALAAAGCGTPAGDLFVVERRGSIEGATLRLRVRDDGTVRCNDDSGVMASKLLIEARVLSRDLDRVLTGDEGENVKREVTLPPRPGSTLRYDIRVEHGVVRFADTSARQPEAFYRAALIVRRIAKEACGLAR